MQPTALFAQQGDLDDAFINNEISFIATAFRRCDFRPFIATAVSNVSLDHNVEGRRMAQDKLSQAWVTG